MTAALDNSRAPLADRESPALGLGYQPGLDGLRGVAVLAVVLFHSGFTWARGGYLGVSTFFTVSGFLITSLLLAEASSSPSGRINLRAFWGRRFRRLLPASLAAIGMACAYAATVADPEQVADLRGDAMAALGYAANWRFILSEESYADLFSGPSPVLHFWSLAIEEQFYLLFPAFVVGLLSVAHQGRRGRLLLGGGLITVILASLCATVGFDWSQDRIYFGTDTRAPELLLGALLAVVTTGRALPRPARAAATIAGPLALLALVALMSATSQSSEWLYAGGFAGIGLLSCVVVLSSIQPTGPIRSVLSVAPLVALGKISYGVYLYHWVIFLWLTPQRTGLDSYLLLALRVGVTIAIAAFSSVVLEQPIRRRRVLTTRQAAVALPAALVVMASVVVVVTVDPPEPLIDFESAQAQLASIEIAPIDEVVTGPMSDPAGTGPPAAPPPRLAMFGDSTALMTGVGLLSWMEETELAVTGGGNSWLGCGVGRGGERRSLPGDAPEDLATACDDWAVSWPQALTAGQPDLAVVQVGPWEVVDRKIPGDDQWRFPGDPVYDDYLRSEILAATDVLASQGAEVVWLTSPAVGPGLSGEEIEIRGDAADPDRMTRLNQLIEEVVAARPGIAHQIDLAGYLESIGEDVRLRPDGVHFAPEGAIEVVTTFLGPELLNLYEAEWPDRWISENGNPEPEPLRALTVGDSTAMMVSFGLNQYSFTHPDITLASSTEIGCGIGRGGDRDYHGSVGAIPEKCLNWPERWSTALAESSPHVVVLLTGPFDVTNRRLPNDDVWRAPGDPIYDEYLLSEFNAAADILTPDDTLLIWLTSPLIEVGRADVTPVEYPASDPVRMARLNEIIAQIDTERDDVVTVDYAGHLATYPGGELDATMRPDGIHLANATTGQVAEWLAPEIQRVYAQWVADRWRAGLWGAPTNTP